MAEKIIEQADLSTIERNLSVIHQKIQSLDSSVETVNDNVKVVYREIDSLAKEFHDFVDVQKRANRLGQAETRLVKIRQELDKKYGHYDIVRRTTLGILQADDLGIVKKDTITNASEERMLETPNYWLSPCLVALAAWINDKQELAEKALREAIKRNDEKTSLFFALVCCRANRKSACLKWTQRYLANQDEENLDRKTTIILDAFASGLLGADSEGVITRQLGEWLEHLSEKPGFIEQQTNQWSEAINLKRKPVKAESYIYLKEYSSTWSVLKDVYEGANLHAEILQYFTNIFQKQASIAPIKVQLDEVLNSLVTDFDDEELPLRKEETFEQFVVKFEGDEERAKKSMSVEQTAFEIHKDFTQLLTDVAMKPESSHASVSTQKFAIALSRDWILDAYRDIVAQNRIKVPHEIEFTIDTFKAKTTDGQNETKLLENFRSLMNLERSDALAKCILTGFDKFCLPGGGIIAAFGAGMIVTGSIFLGGIAMIAGIGMVVNHFSKKKNIETTKQNIQAQYEEKCKKGSEIIRAILAEVVDFRSEFAEKDAESQQVIDFLEQITPEQYIRKLAESNRRIKV